MGSFIVLRRYLVVAHGLSCCCTWTLLWGMWDLHSPTRDQRMPCIARQILNQWTTREVSCVSYWILMLTVQDRCSIHATSENIVSEGRGGSPQVCSLYNMCSFYLSGHTGALLLPAPPPHLSLLVWLVRPSESPLHLLSNPAPRGMASCYVQVPLCQLAPHQPEVVCLPLPSRRH